MANAAEDFITSLDGRVAGILDACTACGDCVRICPTPAATGNDVSDGGGVARGILDILGTGAGPDNARRFATECCGSGACLSVCPEGINPRFMLLMARRALNAGKAEADRKAAGKAAFAKMSRAVRVMSRLQLPPDLMARLSPSSHPERDGAAPDVVFYTGCNMLRTPHIGLLCLDVLDRIGVTYEVHGGPSDCCGILQMRPGDIANSGRQAATTAQRFADSGAGKVLAWCPTCNIQFGETVLPSRPTSFEMAMFPVFLAERLDDLRPLLTRRVEKRVAVRGYPGAVGVTEAVDALLRAVPGVEVVDLGVPGIGYQLTTSGVAPGQRERHIAETLRAAEALGVDVLADVYHGDHRELAAHESEWPFAVANYMELIGESLGLDRPDTYKRLRLMADADAMMTAAQDLMDAHGLDPEEVRDVLVSDMLGGQFLPVDRSRHPG